MPREAAGSFRDRPQGSAHRRAPAESPLFHIRGSLDPPFPRGEAFKGKADKKESRPSKKKVLNPQQQGSAKHVVGPHNEWAGQSKRRGGRSRHVMAGRREEPPETGA